MLKKTISFLFFLFSVTITFGQQFPVGSCGIVTVHDANGCRTKRTYFCNNGIDPWPTKANPIHNNDLIEILDVVSLFPNPTSNIIQIEFRKPLGSATLILTDLSGKVLVQKIISGSVLKLDLVNYSVGSFYLNIKEGKFSVTKKIIKL